MRKVKRLLSLIAISLSLIFGNVPNMMDPHNATIEVSAHSGRTDSSGGHKDNKNKSGLGSYHYHCNGNPPHLHKKGVCPYKKK